MPEANILAYCDRATITEVKIFIVQAPEANLQSGAPEKCLENFINSFMHLKMAESWATFFYNFNESSRYSTKVF